MRRLSFVLCLTACSAADIGGGDTALDAARSQDAAVDVIGTLHTDAGAHDAAADVAANMDTASGDGGNADAMAALGFDFPELDFYVISGTASPQQSVYVLNAGDADSTMVPTFYFSGADACDFSVVADECVTVLHPHERCRVGIKFRPSTTGPKMASLRSPSIDGFVKLVGTQYAACSPAPDMTSACVNAASGVALQRDGVYCLSCINMGSAGAYRLDQECVASTTLPGGTTMVPGLCVLDCGECQ